ncbi:MAG: dephospho-CoA kinase [Alistipes sp.]|nr:dephospho-CoA kinase [Alistipes sp.]
MYKIGITGGIGSGKSTVCALFREQGVAVYDSDAEAKRLMAESADLRRRLIEAFGEECYNAEGLDRKYLASKVFGCEEALQRLNSIVHPAVREDFRAWAERQRGSYVVLESAILFEAGFENEVDATLAVMAPLEERVRRTMERDGVEREQVMERIKHQMSDDELHARANRTLVNLRREYLESDVEQLHKMYCYEARR